jgi:hypothetical protein
MACRPEILSAFCKATCSPEAQLFPGQGQAQFPKMEVHNNNNQRHFNPKQTGQVRLEIMWRRRWKIQE